MIADSIDHAVIYSGDSERTIAFYKDVLGCEIRYEEEWRAGKYPVFQVRINERQFVNVHPAGSELHPRARVPATGAADICFRTSLAPEAVVAHLQSKGVEIVTGPVPRSTADGLPGMSVYFRDGDGNLLELMSTVEREG